MNKYYQHFKFLIGLFLALLITNSCGKSTVEPESNQNPTIANALTTLTLDEGFGTHTVNLITVFEDSDNDNLTLTAQSSETGVVTVNISGTSLTITEVGVGKSNISITANDGNGGTANMQFSVIVAEKVIPNNPPVIANSLSSLELNEGFSTEQIDISTVFTDADGDNLSLSVSSSDESVATANVSGGTLTLTEKGNGTTTITLTADDGNGGVVSNEFGLKIVEAVTNSAPTIVGLLSDLNLNEGFSTEQIDISAVFTDEDGDNLSFSVVSSNESVATASVSGTTLTLTEKGNGTTTITLTADDGNDGTASTGFSVTITGATNQKPTVANALQDLELEGGFANQTIDISTVFADGDGDNLTITVSSTNTNAATASISGNSLVITEQGNGETAITLTADDGNGGTVVDQFNLTIVSPTISFANQVKSIIDLNCAISGCHVAGTGRQNFTSFAVIQANADGIKARTASGNMPRGGGSLTTEEKKLIADWVDQGAKNN
jgi:hypothetical protein